jgi:hypothetical protein
MYLSEEWLAYERTLGFRPVITGTVEEIRAGYNSLSETIAKQLPPHDPAVITVRTSGPILLAVFSLSLSFPSRCLFVTCLFRIKRKKDKKGK